MNWQFWQKNAYVVLKIEPADLPALAEIHAAGFLQGWDADSLSRMLDSPLMAGWLATRRGERDRPLGFVLVRNSGEEAEIMTIATDPTARNKGVGRALMGHAIRELQRDRVRRLFLEVSEDNAAALKLYRSLGFRQVGARKGYYVSQGAGRPGGAPSALVMELDLG